MLRNLLIVLTMSFLASSVYFKTIYDKEVSTHRVTQNLLESSYQALENQYTSLDICLYSQKELSDLVITLESSNRKVDVVVDKTLEGISNVSKAKGNDVVEHVVVDIISNDVDRLLHKAYSDLYEN